MELDARCLAHALGDEARIASTRNAGIAAQLPEDGLGGKPGQRDVAEVGAMSAPAVPRRIAHEASAYRAQMDVAHELQKIRIVIDQQCFIAALEQRAAAVELTIESLRVPKRQILERTGQRALAGLHSEMNVVVHQAKAMHAVAEAFDSFAQQRVEALAILVIEEDIALLVAAPDDVIEATGDMQAGFARHGSTAFR